MDKHEEKSSHDKIELRSEKVRTILGEVPNGLVRRGTVIICIIFIMLLAAVCLLKYPHGNGETIIEHVTGRIK